MGQVETFVFRIVASQTKPTDNLNLPNADHVRGRRIGLQGTSSGKASLRVGQSIAQGSEGAHTRNQAPTKTLKTLLPARSNIYGRVLLACL